MKVNFDNIAITRLINGSIVPLNTSLAKIWNEKWDIINVGEYELTIEVDLQPFELVTLNITENPDKILHYNLDEEKSLQLAP
jgi:hypothetical protein